MAKCQSYGHLGARDHGTKWSVWICMEAMLGATNKVLRYDLKTNNWPYITATLLFFWSKQIIFYILAINSLSLYKVSQKKLGVTTCNSSSNSQFFFGTPCIISISISYSILGRKGRWKFILKMFRFKWENDWCMACCILSLDIKCEMLNKFTLHVSSIIVTNVFCGKTGE